MSVRIVLIVMCLCHIPRLLIFMLILMFYLLSSSCLLFLVCLHCLACSDALFEVLMLISGFLVSCVIHALRCSTLYYSNLNTKCKLVWRGLISTP
ncbi:hypothetical protein BDW59DRAFT_38200 [Aspergillus cavernicola]|uniref:Uncharacterized protein n=1 Tax=Aspergillus cavernicola TaxID=176166 RepID=A0ABR4IN99_9EURO